MWISLLVPRRKTPKVVKMCLVVSHLSMPCDLAVYRPEVGWNRWRDGWRRETKHSARTCLPPPTDSAREEEWGRCEEQINVAFLQTGSLQMWFSLLIWPNTVSAAQKYTNLHWCSVSSLGTGDFFNLQHSQGSKPGLITAQSFQLFYPNLRSGPMKTLMDGVPTHFSPTKSQTFSTTFLWPCTKFPLPQTINTEFSYSKDMWTLIKHIMVQKLLTWHSQYRHSLK